MQRSNNLVYHALLKRPGGAGLLQLASCFFIFLAHKAAAPFPVMAEDDFGDFEGAPAPLAASPPPGSTWAPRLRGVKPGAPIPLEFFEEPAAVPAAIATAMPPAAAAGQAIGPCHAKGDLVWYSQRDGTWVAAEVASVDISITPPSYCVLVAGAYRETEGYRLCARSAGQPPPASMPRRAATAATAAMAVSMNGVTNGDSFVSAAFMEVSSSSSSQQQQQQLDVQQLSAWHPLSRPGQPALQPAGSEAPATHAAGQGVPAPSTAAAAVNDDFGDFEFAEPAQAPPVQQQLQQHSYAPPSKPLPQQQAEGPPAPASLLQPPAAVSSSPPSSSGLWQRWQQRQPRSQQSSPDRLSRQQGGKPAPLQLPRQQQGQQQQPAPGSASPPHSPLTGRRSEAAVQSPLASPRRTSPAMERFHSFLRFAAPDAALRMETEDQEAKAGLPAVGGAAPAAVIMAAVAEDEWGDFGAAEAMPGPTAWPQQQQGHGVNRAAPLPLDIFGEEEAPAEDPPVPPLSQASLVPPSAAIAAVAAAAAENAAAAAAGQGVPGAVGVERSAGPAPAAGGGQPAGGLHGPAAPPNGASAGGWGEDGFGDFIEAEPPLAELQPQAWGEPVSPHVPTAAAAADGQTQSGSSGSGPASPTRRSPSEGDSAAEIHGAEGSTCKAGGARAALLVPAAMPVVAPLGGDAAGAEGQAGGGLEGAAADGVAKVGPSGEIAASGASAPEEDWGGFGEAEPAADQPAASQPAPGEVAAVAPCSSAAPSPAVPALEAPSPAVPALEAPSPAVPSSPAGAKAGPGGAMAAGGHWQEVVTEYGVAWARLLEVAARELERGQRLWREACEGGCAGALLAHPSAQRYLASLGHVYLAAVAVQEAARLLGLLALVWEIQAAWARCQAAWEAPAPAPVPSQVVAGSGPADLAGAGAAEGACCDDGAHPSCDGGDAGLPSELSFREAVLLSSSGIEAERAEGEREGERGEDGGAAVERGAAPPLESQLAVLQRAGVKAEALPLDAFPRMLEWSEGLDGLTLLPLALLAGIPVAPGASWLKGRPCIVPVANLWAGCLPRALPDLD